MAKFCSTCGNPLQDNDKFCRKCGTKVIARAAVADEPGFGPAFDMPAADEKPIANHTYGMQTADENSEGTTLLGDVGKFDPTGFEMRSAKLPLSLNEMLDGCKKIVDFGTGTKYELTIPAGQSPGDMIYANPGVTDSSTGRPYKIELTLTME